MVEYGNIEYWNQRYDNEADNPFDWLVDYRDVKDILSQILPKDKTERILIPGCGNAPFSPDLCFEDNAIKDDQEQTIGIHSNQIVSSPSRATTINSTASSAIAENSSTFSNAVALDGSTPTKASGLCYEAKSIGNSAELLKSFYHFSNVNLQWKVMDVLDLDLEDHSIKTIIDKSLIDTLMCYSDGQTKTRMMLSELHRVLSPGGRYVTFSLHSIEEVKPYFESTVVPNSDGTDKMLSTTEKGKYTPFDWQIRYYRVKSSRWTLLNRRRAVACTMIVCYKNNMQHGVNTNEPMDIMGTLSEEEYERLELYSREINLREAFRIASISDLMISLDNALLAYDRMTDSFIEDASSSLKQEDSEETYDLENDESGFNTAVTTDEDTGEDNSK